MSKPQSQLSGQATSKPQSQLSGRAIVVILLAIVALAARCNSNHPITVASNPVTNSSNPIASSPVKPLPKPRYIRPTTADNGAPFPTESGYIDSYPVQFDDGYSTITVDNSQNGSDVYVKLSSVDTQPKTLVRVFFIRAGDQFTAKKVRAGNYDIRYRDLNSGGFSRMEKSFNLKEIKTERGIQFSQLQLTLYKVSGGNMHTSEIPENEF
jgi:hypothetical protein